MKKLIVLLFLITSFNGFSQTVRTLDKVNNTYDSLKVVSIPQQTAINLKQNIINGTGLARFSGQSVTFDNTTYLSSITSGLINGALGYTPYNGLTNTNGYLTTVPAQTYSSLTGKPTTISGYGITDFNSLGDTRYSLVAHVHLFSAITSKPITLSGYGITDAYPLSGNPNNYTTLSAVSSVYSSIASPVHTGDIETTTISAGVIVKSPNGTRFRLSVSNLGDIIATSL